MEARKMVLMNLFAWHHWRGGHRTYLGTQWGKEKVGRIERKAWKHVYYHM